MPDRPNPLGDEQVLSRLLPASVVAVEGRLEEIHGELHPEEAACVTRAVDKRVEEFRAGRVCARQAMATLGLPDAPLVSREDRRPAWPDGVVGSISHCRGYCGAVVARNTELQSVGIDIEVAGAVKEKLFKVILSETEQQWCSKQDDPTLWGTLLFSAKEASYKAWYPATLEFLEFSDLVLEVDVEKQQFRSYFQNGKGQGRELLQGQYHLSADWVFTGVAMEVQPS